MPGRTRSRTPVDPKKKQLRIYKERLAGLLTSIAHTSGAEKAKLEEDAEALRQKIPDAQVTAHSAAQNNLAVFRRLHHFRYLRATQQRAVAPLQNCRWSSSGEQQHQIGASYTGLLRAARQRCTSNGWHPDVHRQQSRATARVAQTVGN